MHKLSLSFMVVCFRLFFLAAILPLAVTGVFGAPPGGWRQLNGHLPAAVSKLAPLGRLDPTNRIYLAIGLPLHNQAELDAFVHELYDPASTNFHRYLTPDEFTARFGPTEQEYQAVVDFAWANGLEISETHGDRMLLDVSGPAANVQQAFQVTLNNYRHPADGRKFYAPDSEPSVPAGLSVADVQGLSDFGRPQPLVRAQPAGAQANAAQPHSGSAPGGGGQYFGGDFRAAYVPGTSLTGAGQTVGLVQFDGYYSNDIVSYETQAGLANVPLQNVLLDSYSGTPTGGNGTLECSLDIEMAIAMAPGISKLIVYEGNPNNFIPNDVLSRIASDNLAKQVSSSWSWNNGPNATTDSYLLKMVTQGQSVFFASGDSDAYTGANTIDTSSSFTTPITSTNVTAVGGTTLSTSGAGGAWTGETVWNYNPYGGSFANVGSSGGISTYYSIPYWQTNVTTVGNSRSTTKRNIPDVALTADNVYVIYNNGATTGAAGTSCAAPLWAGFTALINQQAALAAKSPIGFINPALYALATNANYTSLFHDITTGNNIGTNTAGLYYAVAGYDLCTGLGTPGGTNLINALMPLVFAPAIAAGNWTLAAESATPTNGAVDPGETVAVSFTLKNSGNLATSNLVATLVASGNVLAPSSPQAYGSLAASGGTAARPFTFTAAGTCGSNITATLQLQDGTNNLGVVGFAITLGGASAGRVQTFAQNFDSVTVPALPSGWSATTVSGTANGWVTSKSSYSSSPNSAFDSDSASPGQNALVSPAIAIAATNAQLAFRHNYSFENYGGVYYDGGILEIQIGGGAFTDIIAAGGSFAAGGYNSAITTTSDNPLGGDSGWVGSSGTWKRVVVNLPPAAAGQSVRLRWNCATDSGNSGGNATGWYVDSITVTDAVLNCVTVLADISAGQSLAANSLWAGSNLVYTLTVTNAGPQPAANVVVTDAVPANATFVSAPGGNYSAGNIVFSAGMLPAGGATNFTLTLAPAAGLVFTNVVTVATVTPEAGTANNTSTLVSAQVAAAAPAIAAGPAAQSVECGSGVAFSVSVTGSPPLSFQWSLDGQPLAGATNATLALAGVHLPSHTVAVTVTNVFGSATSSATLSVHDTLAPAITLAGGSVVTNELGAAFVDPGASATDQCAGTVPVTATGAVNTAAVGTNFIIYRADDGNGNTNTAMRAVIVRDTTPPAIVWSFTNLVLTANSNCLATMPDVTGTNFIMATDLSGAVTFTQSPTNGSALAPGKTMVTITAADASGNSSHATNLVFVMDGTPPVILSNPASQTNYAGTTANFSVSATACTALAYQWYFNSAPLAGQTNPVLVLSNLAPAAAGNYYAVATAAGGSSASAPAGLTVLQTAPSLAAVAVPGGGGFTVSFNCLAGSTYVLEGSTNFLSGWTPIATNTAATNGVSLFTDPQPAALPQRFYRLRVAQ